MEKKGIFGAFFNRTFYADFKNALIKNPNPYGDIILCISNVNVGAITYE